MCIYKAMRKIRRCKAFLLPFLSSRTGCQHFFLAPIRACSARHRTTMKLHTSSLLLSLALAVALHSASARSLPAVRVPVNRPFVVPAQWRRFSFDSDSPSEDGTVVARPHAQNPGPAVEPSPGGPNSQTRPDPRPAPKLNTRPRPHALSAGPAMRPPSGSPNAVQGTATASAPLSPNDFPRTQSTDKPRFVLYGDQWVQGSKLGVPDPNKIKGFTHYNAAFWMATSGPADNAMAWTQGSDDERKAIVKSYNEAGIKLMVSAFGATDVPQTSAGLGNATKTANRLADFVIKYQFQGVDVDYEELDSFANGRGVPWLIALTKQLRKRLPAPKYVITHAPLAPWFSRDVYKDGGYSTVHKDVGKLIDFYNVQVSEHSSAQ